MRIRPIATLAIGCAAVQGAISQLLDPIKNYCSLWDHQSVVKNDILYIYMGTETFVDAHTHENYTKYRNANGTITVGYNEHVINLDLRISWDSPANIEVASNVTANPSTGFLPPQVVRGALYQGSQSDDSVYLYGGTTSYANASFPGWQPPTPSTYSLWSYDPLSTQWSNFDISQVAPLRPGNGAAAEAVDQGLAFYFNGELDSGSFQETGIKNGTYDLVKGMVVINTTDQTARNLSTAQVSTSSARAGGRMQYIPGIGEKGILVLIGGSTFPVPPNMFNGIVDLVSMTEIFVFDIASIYNSSTPDGVWYKQNATNQNVTNIPSPRVDFCLVVASAQDGSSHNIYMYGGRDSANYRFAEVWVLSLPSFTWNLVTNANDWGTSPKFAHTCHFVGNRTMLSVGGVFVFQDETSEDSGCDWATNGIWVYDTSDLVWSQGFNATTPAYEVPEALISTIGGGRLGGATMKTPAAKFNDDGLARLFSYGQNTSQGNDTGASQGNNTDASQGRSNSTNASQGTKTEAPADSAHKQTAIVAGTLGGIVVLAILVGLGCYVAKEQVLTVEDEPLEKDDDVVAPQEAVEPIELQAAAVSEPSVQDGSLPVRED